MSGDKVLQATAIIDIEDRAGGKIEKLAKKLQSLERLTKMMGKAEGFAAFDRQARGIEKAATAIGHLERQVANLTRLNNVAGDIDKISRAVERLDRANARGAASGRKLHESLSWAERAGQAGMMAGPAVLAGTRRAWHAGAELQHVEVQMRQAGMSADEIGRARGLAGSLARDLPTLSIAELMELHKETRSSVQHAEEAFHLLPELARAKAALKGMGVENASLAEIVKGGESLGLMSDPTRFARFLEGQVKAMSVMGKTITTEQIFEAAKYSKSAGATLSDGFLNLVLPSLIQEMHGSSAGDALSMLVKTFRGGMQNKHVPVEKMAELGLLADPDKIVKSKTGSIKGYKGKIVGDELLSSDPDKWFTQVFKPAAEKAGYSTLSEQVRLLNMVLPQTAANLGRILIQQEQTLKAHRALYENAPGLDTMVENLKDDPTAQLTALGHSIENFAGVLASPVMSDAAHMMESLAATIGGWQERLSKWQKENPEWAWMAGGGALAAGGAAGAAGTYGLVTGLLNGFGLKGSAAALDGSAGALTAAAGRLGGGVGGVPGGPGAAGKPTVGVPWMRGILQAGLFGWLVESLPEPGTPEWDKFHEDVDRRNASADDWLRKHTPPSLRFLYGPSSNGGSHPTSTSGYVTGGGFGGGMKLPPEVERANQMLDLVDKAGGMVAGSGSVWDASIAARITPAESIPLPQPRQAMPYDAPLPIPRPSEAELAGFGDALKSQAADFGATLTSAFAGTLAVSLEVKPGPMFEAYVTNIAKTQAERVNATGPGSTGANGSNVDQHN